MTPRDTSFPLSWAVLCDGTPGVILGSRLRGPGSRNSPALGHDLLDEVLLW